MNTFALLRGRDATAEGQASAGGPARNSAEAPKFAYIDCLRGYAVLMVMITHTTYAFAGLPYPVHKLGAYGWHGVQLFFLASSLTLLMSHDQERRRTGGFDASHFFIRRFLRIAPMYYLAAGFYALLLPPLHPTLRQLAASLAFVNAWAPRTMPTVGGAWMVVPGGWSIGVEFTLYFLFPVLALAAASLRRLLPLLAASLVAAAVLNSLLLPGLTQAYGAKPADNFLYFWFPNQAPVFLLGGVVFLAIRALERRPDHPLSRAVRRWSGVLVGGGLAAELVIAWFPQRFGHQLLLAPAVPQYLAAALAFVPFIIGLSQARRSRLVNPVMASLGKVSFSAYLLHFAVLRLLPHSHPGLFHVQAQSWGAIVAFAACCVVVSVTSYIASYATYRAVEEPFMRLAKQLTQPKRTSAAEAPQLAA